MRTFINGIQDDLTPVGISQLGTVVFDNVLFPAGSYVDLNGITQNYSEVKLDSVAMVINLPKNIVRSRVSGRNGTIKEYISDDDFQIDITVHVR